MNMTNNKKLKEKVAIVTGAARGIGKSIALRLAKEGALVIISDILEKDSEKTALELQKYNSKCLYIKTDVSKKNDVQNMVKSVAKKFGKIDILVNNAGVSGRSTIEALSEEWLDRVLSINAKGPFFCIQAVYPYMKKQKYGKIINIVSSAVKIGGSIAKETRPDGSTTISRTVPAYVIAKGGLIALKYNFEDLPIARMGTPEDVANAVMFFASDDSGYTTGHVLDVDGGL